VRLVACSDCHTQYDVADLEAKTIPCRCGSEIEIGQLQAATDTVISRCGSCGAGLEPDATSCSYCGSDIVRDPDELSLICPECFARCADDSRFCVACGIAFRPEPLRIDGHELPCPACSVLMPPRQISGVALNECLTCHGLWAPGESFDRLVSRAIRARQNAGPAELHVLKPRVTGSNPAGQSVEYRRCPECDGYMQRRNYRKKSGVIIDSCPNHGIWLDADELEQIAGFILSGSAGSPDQPETAEERQKKAAAGAATARIQVQHGKRGFGETSNRSAERDVVDSIVSFLSGILK
jgi:Zn-finger nucleic acid-binding protein